MDPNPGHHHDNGDDDDRRVFPRTAFTILVQLSIVDDDEEDDADEDRTPAVSGITADMSRGGLAAWVGDAIPAGSRCLVRFLNSRGRVQPDTVMANVRRAARDTDGSLIGVEFDQPLETFKLRRTARAHLTVRRPRARVLVADDQQDVRDLLRRFLKLRGFDVQVTTNGEETLEALRNDPPDVLLLDLYMPQMTGHEILRRIRDEHLEVGVICTISGYATQDDAQECLRLGAVDHIPKPLDLKHLDWSLRLRLGVAEEA